MPGDFCRIIGSRYRYGTWVTLYIARKRKCSIYWSVYWKISASKHHQQLSKDEKSSGVPTIIKGNEGWKYTDSISKATDISVEPLSGSERWQNVSLSRRLKYLLFRSIPIYISFGVRKLLLRERCHASSGKP